MTRTVTSPEAGITRDKTVNQTTSQENLVGELVQETLALTKRLFIQLQRRPSTLIAGMIQPLMWLILFGALFQNVPEGLFGGSENYAQFLGAGVIVFTGFSGALNAGLPFENIIIDPGIGFGKTVDDNLYIINHLDMLFAIKRPILIGTFSVFHCFCLCHLYCCPEFYSNGGDYWRWGIYGGWVA